MSVSLQHFESSHEGWKQVAFVHGLFSPGCLAMNCFDLVRKKVRNNQKKNDSVRAMVLGFTLYSVSQSKQQKYHSSVWLPVDTF